MLLGLTKVLLRPLTGASWAPSGREAGGLDLDAPTQRRVREVLLAFGQRPAIMQALLDELRYPRDSK